MESTTNGTGHTNPSGLATLGGRIGMGIESARAQWTASDAAQLYVSSPDFAVEFDGEIQRIREDLQGQLDRLDARSPAAKPKSLTIRIGAATPEFLEQVTVAPRKLRAKRDPNATSAARPTDEQIMQALQLITDAGESGIKTGDLGKALGARSGWVVAPLIASGKVKATGKNRGVTYALA